MKNFDTQTGIPGTSAISIIEWIEEKISVIEDKREEIDSLVTENVKSKIDQS